MNNHTTHQPDDRPQRTDGRRAITRGLGLGLGAGLLAGGAIGLLGVWPGASSAADTVSDPSAIVVPTQDDTTDDTGDDTTDDTADETAQPDDRLRELLQPLVDDGTIDAVQADAVASYLVDQRIERGPMARPHGGVLGHGLDAAADSIGIDVETLRDELRAGSTIAEIATANGVAPQTVIDALVADAQEHLDAAVENGRLEQAEADERTATLEERITDRVNGETPLREFRDRRDGA